MFSFPIALDLIVYLPIFLIALFVSVYIPGRILIIKFKTSNLLEKFVLSNIVGIVALSFQSFVFGWMNMRFLTYFYILFFIAFFLVKIKNKKEFLPIPQKKTIKKSYGLLILIAIGSLLQMLAVFPSGLQYQNGIRFFSTNEADGIMHLSYIQSIANYFPPIEPGLSGTLLKNYHYWSDMFISEFYRIFRIPVSILFFQFMPLYVAPLIGLTAIALVRVWRGSNKMALWLLVLLYFASDASFTVIFLIHQKLGFHTPAIDSSLLQFLNMPHAIGKVIFFGTLISITKWISGDARWGYLSVILAASLVGFKVYFGMYLAIGLISYLSFQIVKNLIQKRVVKNIPLLFQGLLFSVLCMLIYLPHNAGAGGLVYVYLEWPKSLLGIGSIDWRDWWLRRQVYEAHSNIRNLLFLDFLAVLIAYISIYGTRLVGFFPSRTLYKFLTLDKILILIPPLIVFQILGLFTIQSSGGVNVYNFFSVSSVIVSIISAYYLSKLKLNSIGIFVGVVFILLTVPRSFHEMYSLITYYKNNQSFFISSEEQQAFGFLKTKTPDDSVIQAHPANPGNYLSPYVAYFANRSTYLSGANLLKTHNIPVDERSKKIDELFQSNEIVDFATKARNYGIDYIYLRKVPEENITFQISNPILEKVFENDKVIVLQVYSDE